MVAHVVPDHNLVLFHTHGQHLLLGEGDGLVGRAYKAGDAADISHQMPSLVRHDHLNQHIAGKDLPLHILGGAGVSDLGHSLHGNLHPEDLILHAPAGDKFLNTGLDGVFVAGIGMDHIPLRAV